MSFHLLCSERPRVWILDRVILLTASLRFPSSAPLNSQIVITVFHFIHHTHFFSLWVIIRASFLSLMHLCFTFICYLINSKFLWNFYQRICGSNKPSCSISFYDQLSLFFTCGLLQFVLFFCFMFLWCRVELFHPRLVDIVWWPSLEYTFTRWIKPNQYWRLYWWCKRYIYGDLRIIKIIFYFCLVLQANHQSSILRLILCAFQYVLVLKHTDSTV